MMDFSLLKKLSIHGVALKKLYIGAPYTNRVPLSIDTDGSLYENGKGCVDGYRLSTSGALKEQGSTVTTGFIKATKNDVVRMAGTKWNQSAGYNYFAVYDEYFNLIDSINFDGTGNASAKGWSYCSKGIFDAANTYVYVENEITRFEIAMTGSNEYAYIRISAYGSGDDMIVTVNEEIVKRLVWKRPPKNWVQYSTEADGVTIYNGGLGYKDGYRVRSGGAEATLATATCTGYIPVEGLSVVRVMGDGTGFTTGSTGSAINVFDSAFTNLGQIVGNINSEGYGIFASDGDYAAYGGSSVVQEENYWKWTVPPEASGIKYIRVTGVTNYDRDSTHAELIVTINEEIV